MGSSLIWEGSMKKILYIIWQCTWGGSQTLLGLILFVQHIKSRHFVYHGAVITEWNTKTSISLGLFVFVTANPFFVEKFEGQLTAGECSKRLLVHEYGHKVQSLILGPMYLIVIGIPSMLWGFFCSKKRKKAQVAYGAFFTEGWANRLGEWVTGETSIGDMVLE